jgi:hypothetical protein
MLRERSLKQARLLIMRLERLSADSIWAHRASGLRGSLFIILERYEGGSSSDDPEELNKLLNTGYFFLEQALKDPGEKAINQVK